MRSSFSVNKVTVTNVLKFTDLLSCCYHEKIDTYLLLFIKVLTLYPAMYLGPCKRFGKRE